MCRIGVGRSSERSWGRGNHDQNIFMKNYFYLKNSTQIGLFYIKCLYRAKIRFRLFFSSFTHNLEFVKICPVSLLLPGDLMAKLTPSRFQTVDRSVFGTYLNKYKFLT